MVNPMKKQVCLALRSSLAPRNSLSTHLRQVSVFRPRFSSSSFRTYMGSTPAHSNSTPYTRMSHVRVLYEALDLGDTQRPHLPPTRRLLIPIPTPSSHSATVTVSTVSSIRTPRATWSRMDIVFMFNSLRHALPPRDTGFVHEYGRLEG